MTGQPLHNATETFSAGPLADSWTARTVEQWAPRIVSFGALTVALPSGARLVLRGRLPGLQAELSVRNWRVLRRLLTGWDIGFADAYVAGEWSSSDPVAVLKWAVQNRAAVKPLKLFRLPQVGLRLRHAMNRNTRRQSRRNIAAHYDLGNAFYATWLDAGMAYSSALYSAPSQTLESAQQGKNEKVAALLNLHGGERILEIGCGWGGLAEHLARRHHASVIGITLSTEQRDHARDRLKAEIAAGRCDIRLQDYRDVAGAYDRIVSIEMLEAVGEAYWPLYFRTLRERLKPGGAAVVQVITIADDRYATYRRKPDFIQKYIFPGGFLPTKSLVKENGRAAGLEPDAVECFGPSYARTLAEWRRRFHRGVARP